MPPGGIRARHGARFNQRGSPCRTYVPNPARQGGNIADAVPSPIPRDWPADPYGGRLVLAALREFSAMSIGDYSLPESIQCQSPEEHRPGGVRGTMTSDAFLDRKSGCLVAQAHVGQPYPQRAFWLPAGGLAAGEQGGGRFSFPVGRMVRVPSSRHCSLVVACIR
ncbi:hypothetical protein VUR80DRAFT_3155 [Thermomyces stellatus]